MKSKTALLKRSELKKLSKLLPLWSINTKETELVKTRTFGNHLDGLVFIARVTVHAQVLNHHPLITFGYKKVTVKLTTHELKGISNLDVDLAKKIDTLK